jgi:hypothetical protein
MVVRNGGAPTPLVPRAGSICASPLIDTPWCHAGLLLDVSLTVRSARGLGMAPATHAPELASILHIPNLKKRTKFERPSEREAGGAGNDLGGHLHFNSSPDGTIGGLQRLIELSLRRLDDRRIWTASSALVADLRHAAPRLLLLPTGTWFAVLTAQAPDNAAAANLTYSDPATGHSRLTSYLRSATED